MLSFHLGGVHYFCRHYDQAIDQFQKAIELDPSFVPTHQLLALAYARSGDFHKAAEEAEKRIAMGRGDLPAKGFLAVINGLMGNLDVTRQVLNELEECSKPPHFSHAYVCAGIHALLGEKDQALQWLDKAWQGRAGRLIYLACDPAFVNLHGDAGFDAVLRRFGIAG